jgi:hypothetical protein
MTEIITDLDARQLADRLTALELHSTSELARLEQERNEAQDKYATEATEHMLAVNKLCGERDDALSQIAQAECRAERYCQERDEARNAIVGWENKWKCSVDMAARAELERDEALKCAKEYYVEFIRNASSDNKVSKPNPLKPFYKY